MSMYPSVGGALINAFNPSLFDSCKSAGWQKLASALADQYPELDIPAPDRRNFDADKLSRMDWATQAGMTAGILRNHLKPTDFHILRMRYTHDGNRVIAGNCELRLDMSDNARQALIEGWFVVRQELIRQGGIRKSVLENEVRLEYLVLRALRPDVVDRPFQAQGAELQATVNKQQYEVKKACMELFKQASDKAEKVLEEAGLLFHAV